MCDVSSQVSGLLEPWCYTCNLRSLFQPGISDISANIRGDSKLLPYPRHSPQLTSHVTDTTLWYLLTLTNKRSLRAKGLLRDTKTLSENFRILKATFQSYRASNKTCKIFLNIYSELYEDKPNHQKKNFTHCNL